MVCYYKCLRFLLHPLILSEISDGKFLQKCAEACGGVCRTYKKLHQSMPVGFRLVSPTSRTCCFIHLFLLKLPSYSIMALHSVFLAGKFVFTTAFEQEKELLANSILGLTLIYCAWASPKEVFTISTSNDMNACSIVLYIITERWPGARKYRDVYETIKQSELLGHSLFLSSESQGITYPVGNENH